MVKVPGGLDGGLPSGQTSANSGDEDLSVQTKVGQRWACTPLLLLGTALAKDRTREMGQRA